MLPLSLAFFFFFLRVSWARVFGKNSHLQLTAEQHFGSGTNKNEHQAWSAFEQTCSGKPFTHCSLSEKHFFFFFFFSQTQKGRANESTHTETRRKEINFPKCKHNKIFIFKRFALLGRFLNNLVHHIIAIHHRVPACSAVLLK